MENHLSRDAVFGGSFIQRSGSARRIIQCKIVSYLIIIYGNTFCFQDFFRTQLYSFSQDLALLTTASMMTLNWS
jgi:hypothetical protein